MLSLPAGVDPLALARRYEPVLRFTAGEMFFPMPVEPYVACSALWAKDATVDHGRVTELVPHGSLDLGRLCDESRRNAHAELEIRFVERGLGWGELRRWRRDPHRPRFASSPRLAAVGLPGRVIDAFFRLSLVFRGRVPRGLTAAAQQAYLATGAADTHTYYVHVSTDGGYTVLQYWFFYAMNDWRTSFSGVNDHGGDWEQVTVYLSPTDSSAPNAAAATPDGADVLELAWVAFSAHDLVGSDVRRRPDDPDLTWVDGTHPVAFAGAGSHAGAPVRGEYLVQLELPALQRITSMLGWLRGALLPWTEPRPPVGLGIPYVDYKRGDGRTVGPGGDHPWQPVLIDDATAWVRDFRGLWGLDTDDPFGGERAPAGPRYERDGTIRASWGDPVAWAALDAVPATTAERVRTEAERITEIDTAIAALDSEIGTEQETARTLEAGARALFLDGSQPRRRRATPAEASIARLADLRASRRTLTIEREAIERSLDGHGAVPPQAHLRSRPAPLEHHLLVPGALLTFWAGASISVLLALFGLALIFDITSLPRLIVVVILIVMAVEAALRQRLAAFLLGLVTVAVAGALLLLFVRNWHYGLGGLALLAAAGVGLANVRVLLARR